MVSTVEIPFEQNITTDRFWQLAHDLLYTRVYYDQSTGEYFTKCLKTFEESLKLTRTHSNASSAATADDENDREYPEDEIETPDADVNDECTEDEINTLLVSYLTLVCNYSDQMCALIDEKDFYLQITNFLVSFPSFENNLQFCIRKMFSLLNHVVEVNSNNLKVNFSQIDPETTKLINESLDQNENLIKTIGWILFNTYQLKQEPMQFILEEFQGFETISAVLNNYAAISKNTTPDEDLYIENYSMYMELFFELCKEHEFEDIELKALTKTFVEWLLKHLKPLAKEENLMNFLRFKILLILNEQFMVSHYSVNPEYGPGIDNLIFTTMTETNHYFYTFTEILILNFNREPDQVIKILMLKMLYLIFTTSFTCQWIYLNDLKVIVDIMIRELFNLSMIKDEILLNTYLRVLCPLLMFSNLRDEDYKTNQLEEVLNYLETAELASATTKRLAKRCLNLDLFKADDTSNVTVSKQRKW
ncbi:unnamed protein product [Ambrosiozyma monospora]|uniref:Unnamed protein product n=1 Tax=Ambrosiozyma monospora TaxID=43982 RepID=A0A9W6Z298_AMBMO|nr:unnamed protein product [Ambrosiozyma monospora]